MEKVANGIWRIRFGSRSGIRPRETEIAVEAPFPFVYSDLYNHKVFIRGVAGCGFSGLLCSPKVWQAGSPKDLIRRIQTVVFSPHALLNCWRIPHPPWMQVDREKNINGEFLISSVSWKKVRIL